MEPKVYVFTCRLCGVRAELDFKNGLIADSHFAIARQNGFTVDDECRHCGEHAVFDVAGLMRWPVVDKAPPAFRRLRETMERIGARLAADPALVKAFAEAAGLENLLIKTPTKEDSGNP